VGSQVNQDQLQAAVAEARAQGLLQTALKFNVPPGDLYRAVLLVHPDLKLYRPRPRPMGPKRPGPRKGAQYRFHQHRNQNTPPVLNQEQLQAAAALAEQVGTAAAAAEFGVSASGLRGMCKRRGVELRGPIGGSVLKRRAA
jgi:hypothetical protein